MLAISSIANLVEEEEVDLGEIGRHIPLKDIFVASRKAQTQDS